LQISQINTQKEMARIAGVSQDTLYKVMVIMQKASQAQRQMLEKRDASINQVWNEISIQIPSSLS
jgi:Na+/phosphate symporter